MMKSMIVAVVGVAGIAAAANAAWGLRFQVRLADADPWSSSVVVTNPGQVVKFRFGAYFDPSTSITVADGTGPAAALNRFTGQNQFTGMLAGDVITNPATRTISSGNNALTAVAGSKIGGTGITSFGSQLFLSALPDPPETYKEIYVGTITIGNSTAHLLTFKNSQFGSGNTAGLTFYTYASATNKQSAAPNSDSGPRSDQEATIDVQIPAPGSLALVGLGGLVAARRRRA